MTPRDVVNLVPVDDDLGPQLVHTVQTKSCRRRRDQNEHGKRSHPPFVLVCDHSNEIRIAADSLVGLCELQDGYGECDHAEDGKQHGSVALREFLGQPFEPGFGFSLAGVHAFLQSGQALG